MDANSPAEVAVAVQLACLLEASAPKPGNVSPGRNFDDLRYEDFLASASAVGETFREASGVPVGVTIRRAIEATARWTQSNSNLGIVLLLAPLARAAANRRADLRSSLRRVLDETTVEDARNAYAAIRLAAPGGLGRSESQDVAEDPDVTLLESMRLAAARDGIAREYATGFETTFETGAPAIRRARRDGLDWADAVVEAFLTLLAAAPDTHIIRRAGPALAEDVSARARRALAAGGVRGKPGRREVEAMDLALRDPDHRGNPGTTADLTAASIFVVLLDPGGRL